MIKNSLTINEEQLLVAKEILELGGVVALPTETVYGLAANAFNEEAISKVFETKNRPSNNPLIVHIGKYNMLSKLAKNIPIEAIMLVDEFWPGPLTLVLERKEIVSDLITGGKDTVAVRMPNHPLTLSLLNQLEFPVVAPSANRSNHISPTEASHVIQSLGDKAPYVLDGGACAHGIESTIVGFKNGQPIVLRAGAISREQIEEVLDKEVLQINDNSELIAPGMLKKHYSPNTPLSIVGNIFDYVHVRSHNKRVGFIFFKKNNHQLEEYDRILTDNGSLNEAARNLFKTLYELDALGLDQIYIESIPNEGIGVAINDRLLRAATSA